MLIITITQGGRPTMGTRNISKTITIISLCLGFLTQIQAQTEDFTAQDIYAVKVLSHPREGLTEKSYHKLGSGYAFRHEEDVYVITSSESVYHQNTKDSLHTVEIVTSLSDVDIVESEKIEAELVAVNFGNGLALLKFAAEDRELDHFPSWQVLVDTGRYIERKSRGTGLLDEVFLDSSATIFSFSGDNVGSSVKREGKRRIHSFKSTVGILPLVDDFYELEGYSYPHSKGGPVLVQRKGEKHPHFVGIISDHNLSIDPSYNPKAPTSRWPSRTSDECLNLVIPASVVIKWVDQALKKPEAASWKLNRGAQITNSKVVTIAKHSFRETRAYRTLSSSTRGGQGSGIADIKKYQISYKIIQITKWDEFPSRSVPVLEAQGGWKNFAVWLGESELNNAETNYVVQTTDKEDLKGLGHFLNSALKGEPGKFQVLSKHEYVDWLEKNDLEEDHFGSGVR